MPPVDWVPAINQLRLGKISWLCLTYIWYFGHNFVMWRKPERYLAGFFYAWHVCFCCVPGQETHSVFCPFMMKSRLITVWKPKGKGKKVGGLQKTIWLMLNVLHCRKSLHGSICCRNKTEYPSVSVWLLRVGCSRPRAFQSLRILGVVLLISRYQIDISFQNLHQMPFLKIQQRTCTTQRIMFCEFYDLLN